jgi:hypothetical protein
MNKWMLVAAIACSMNVNAMELTQQDMEKFSQSPEEMKKVRELACRQIIIEDELKCDGQRKENLIHKTRATITQSIRLSPDSEPNTCLNMLNTIFQFAFAAADQKSCQNDAYCAAAIVTQKHAQTVNHPVLQSVLAGKQLDEYLLLCLDRTGKFWRK